MILTTVLLLLTLQDAPTPNIFISKDDGRGKNHCEPAVAIDPTNPDVIVIGAIPDKAYSTSDGGKTWRDSTLKSPFGVWGDPVLVYLDGSFYFAHLTNPRVGPVISTAKLDRIGMQRSQDGGRTWLDAGYAGHRPPKDQDKPWAAVDPERGAVYLTWTEFDRYESRKPTDRTRILFAATKDKGQSWSKAVTISDREGDCLDNDGTAEGAVPAVTPDGTIHVTWSLDSKIYYDRSSDGGLTWGEDKEVAQQPGGWKQRIPGMYRCNGFPVLMVDRSNGPHHGTLYLLWSDQRNGPKDTDIFLKHSRDGGDTWSSAHRINNDAPGKHQFFPWLTIDQTSGSLYVIFYDRRRHKSVATDVVLAWSHNGGESFEQTIISERPFLPRRKVFFGDYTNIAAHQGRIVPVWTRQDEGKNSVWTTIIKADRLK